MYNTKHSTSWVKTLLSFADRSRVKMIASVVCAVVSVVGGLVPFVCVYQVLRLFIEGIPDIALIAIWLAIGTVGYLIRILFFGISTVLSHISAYSVLEGLRLEIVDRLMAAPLGRVFSRSIGSIKNVFVDRVEGVEPPLAHVIPELSSAMLLPIGIFVYLCTFDWLMALACIIAVPIGVVPFLSSMKTYNTQYDAYMKANNHVNSVIVEYIEGIEVVKAFNQATSSYKKYADAVTSFKDFTMAWFKSTWKSLNLTISIMTTTLIGTLPVGLFLYMESRLDPAELTMCLILSLAIVAPVMKLALFLNEIKSMEYCVRDASELLDLEQLPDTCQKVHLANYDITFDKVSFAYEVGQSDVLKDIDIHIPQGSFTALVGPSGSGKSTCARLLSRYWDVSSGSISLGETDIRTMSLEQLTHTVSFVTQDNFLFDCSLKENIRLGNPQASDEEVYVAARAACCEDFILKLEEGYDTSAGVAGRRLSGGEKQRIAIARAILKDAPVVILDEATAFTDPENEDKIQQSIASLTKDKTLLVIAHRLTTIAHADQIIVLSNGRVEACGKQQELLDRCSLYRSMWDAHVASRHWAASSKEAQHV